MPYNLNTKAPSKYSSNKPPIKLPKDIPENKEI